MIANIPVELLSYWLKIATQKIKSLRQREREKAPKQLNKSKSEEVERVIVCYTVYRPIKLHIIVCSRMWVS